MGNDGIQGALAAPPLRGLKPLRASAAVRARICLAIELGLLSVGERLPDHEATARALDVSAMTLRRVLGELTEAGILERRPGRGGGTFVASDDPALWMDDDAVRGFRDRTATILRLIEQRALVESALCAEAAVVAGGVMGAGAGVGATGASGANARATGAAAAATGGATHAAAASSMADLALAQEAVQTARNAKEWASFHEADQAFHRHLAHASGLEWALGEHARIADELYGYFVPYPLAYLQDSNEQHGALLEAVRAGDGALAARLAREHVLELKDSMFIAERPLGADRR